MSTPSPAQVTRNERRADMQEARVVPTGTTVRPRIDAGNVDCWARFFGALITKNHVEQERAALQFMGMARQHYKMYG